MILLPINELVLVADGGRVAAPLLDPSHAGPVMISFKPRRKVHETVK